MAISIPFGAVCGIDGSFLEVRIIVGEIAIDGREANTRNCPIGLECAIRRRRDLITTAIHGIKVAKLILPG